MAWTRLGFGLFGRKRHERAGYQLYTQAVRAAREPYYYAELGVPDTLDGRFDMVGLFVALLIRRLHGAAGEGKALGQAVFDAMFADMDHSLREMGVSDMAVGKRVKAMWEALHGRATAYAEALDTGDQPALAAALGRNVWRGAPPPQAPELLAAAALRLAQDLASQHDAALCTGRVAFPPAMQPA